VIEGLAVVLAVAALLALTYVVVSAVLRRLPAGALRLPSGPIPVGWAEVLLRNVPPARGLSPAERDRLLRLVQLFLRDKHFEGAGGLTVTEEMRVTIAAAACLLVLELEGPCYPRLRTVLVYPESFVPKYAGSPTSGQIAPIPAPLMGESWRDGVVVLSWGDVVRGARDPEAHENVVLHEFAHQLDQEDGAGDGTPVLSGGAMRTWGRVLSGEYERLRRDAAADRPSVLDAYGAKNKAEFFAVATEAFFEQPHALERDHAELYAQLRQFYGQDPARRAPPPPPPPAPPPPPPPSPSSREAA
jgi:Mlc titration factor MtfA (ptsG expression regulator)